MPALEECTLAPQQALLFVAAVAKLASVAQLLVLRIIIWKNPIPQSIYCRF